MDVSYLLKGAVFLVAGLLAACGGGGDDDDGGGNNKKPPKVNSFQATPSTTDTGAPVTFSWDVSDANGDTLTCTLDVDGDSAVDHTISDCANATSQAHTYTAAGSHSAKLTVSDGNGGTADRTVTVTVTVANTQPVFDSDFSVTPNPVSAGSPVTFGWDVSDTDGDTLTCTLDVDGDNAVDHTISDCANTTSQAHTYATAGDYTTRLTIDDGNGGTVEQAVSMTVNPVASNTAPVFDTSLGVTPNPVEEGSPATFAWAVSDADGDSLTCGLDVNADGTDDYTISDCANNTSQAHTYTQAGTHQARLSVSDGIAPAVQNTVSVTVSTPPVISQFTMSPNPAYATVATTFYWQVSAPGGGALTCLLDINNDGNDDYTINDCANIASQEHTYAETGDYTVRLTVSDGVADVQTILLLVAVNSYLSLDVSVDGPVKSSSRSRDVEVGRGERALYTITVSNVAARPLDDVSVVYTVASELQFDAVKDAEPNAADCGAICVGGQKASWMLGTLAEGESRTITINAGVLAFVPTGAEIIVPVVVTSSSLTEASSVSKAVMVDNNPTSQLTVSASKDPLIPGDSLTLTFDVGNISSVSLRNLKLRAILPAGFRADSISDSGTEDAASGDVTWDVARLAVGTTLRRSIDVTVNATAISGQILTTRAELRHDGSVTLDARVEQAVTVVETAFPIALNISTTPDPVVLGGRLSYEFTINNMSASSVNGINVLLRVPPEIQFDAAIDAVPSATGCGAACIGAQEASWALDPLASGQSYTIKVDALVNTLLSGGSLLTTPVRVTATNLGDDINRLKTVAVVKPVVGDLNLARKSGCLACHSVEMKVVGPAWKDVADRYRDNVNAQAILVEKIKNGGRGNWGPVPMPPYSPRVSEFNIEALVAYILNL